MLQALPYVSISEGYPAIFLPLVFIIVLTGIKDYFEDRKRKKSDIEENSQNILIWENGNWQSTFWKTLKPGHIVKVKNF